MLQRFRRRVHTLVFGATNKRVRASLRILLPVVLVFVGTIILLTGTAILEAIGVLNTFLADNIQPVISAVIAAGLLVMMGRYLDHRPIPAYGFHISRKWWLNFVAGLVLGGVLLTVIFVVAIGAGGATVVELFSPGAIPFLLGMLFFAAIFACVAFWEETIFRGIVLPNAVEGLAARGLSPKTAVLGGWVGSSVLFAFAHAPFFNSELVSLGPAIVGWILTGGLLGLAYIMSGELAFPLGFHFGSNYTFYIMFGSTTLEQYPTIIRIEWARPELWLWHPNWGVVSMALIVASYGLVTGWYYWRNDGLLDEMNAVRWRTDDDNDASTSPFEGDV